MTTPTAVGCSTGTPIETTHNLKSSSISTQITPAQAQDTNRVYVAQAAAASSTGSGDYSASPLAPSSEWSAGGSTGSFDWSYPLTVPTSRGNLDPDMSVSFDSQEADGRTASTNNQSSRIGEGFSLGESYIERSYKSCKYDGQPSKYDLCWKSDNATLVLNGQANDLVKISGDGNSYTEASAWRLKHDDGTRVLRYKGANTDNDDETWQVTTPDGTTYTFGMSTVSGQTDSTNSVWTTRVSGNNDGEPCSEKGSTFTTRFCTQAWRWNLDYVQDLDNNTMSYWYTAETNNYAQAGGSTAVAYNNGGRLDRVDYGMRGSSATPSGQLVFTSIQRCTTATLSDPTPDACRTKTKTNWPDTPTDQICTDTTCSGKVTPTFFTRYRLAQITAMTRRAGALKAATSWTLNTKFLSHGSGDPSVLFPLSITQKATAADGSTVTNPPVVFATTTQPNRVELNDSSGVTPLDRERLSSVTSESGAQTTVNYSSDTDVGGCTSSTLPPDSASNNKLCYAQKWQAFGNSSARVDWFRKYVVTSVSTTDPTGGSPALTTFYSYSGGGAWVKNDDPTLPDSTYQTYSLWRGFQKVSTVEGSLNSTDQRGETEDLYFRGITGDTLTDADGADHSDSPPLAGFLLQSTTNENVGGAAFTRTISTPWTQKTAGSGTAEHSAYYLAAGESTTSQRAANGDWRQRKTTTDYSASTGLPTSVSDSGLVGTPGDETCTVTKYADNRTAPTDPNSDWILGEPASVISSTGACTTASATPDPATFLSAQRTTYDDGVTLTRALATQEDRISGFTGSSAVWQTTTTTKYDGVGRPTEVDALSDSGAMVPTTTVYTDTDGLLTHTVSTVSANGRSYVTNTDLDPQFGTATKTVDPNGGATRQTYDALGRVTQIWTADRDPAASDSHRRDPNYRFEYNLANTTTSWVKTSALRHDASGYNVSYALLDALLRPRQTQAPSAANTSTPQRLIANTIYDSRGQVTETQQDVLNTDPPSSTLVQVPFGSVPAVTHSTFDGVGRVTKAALYINGTFDSQTTTKYDGDETTTVTPPVGSPPTTSSTDIRGRVVKAVEKGTPDLTTTTSYDLRDNPTSVTGPGGTWNYNYDALGRVTSKKDPDTGTSNTTYTPADSVASTTDARGRTVNRTYDDLARPTGLYSGTDTSHPLTKWTYDNSTNGVGQASSTSRYAPDGTVLTSTVNSYSPTYKPTKTTFSITNPGGGGVATGLPTTYISTALYDYDGQTLQQQTLPAVGSALGYETLETTSTDLGMVQSVRGARAIFNEVKYTALGQPSEVGLGSGTYPYGDDHDIKFSAQYEVGTKRLQHIAAQDQVSAVKYSDHTYTYDKSGNPLSDTDAATGSSENQCYDYDDHARLSRAWTPASANCSTAPSASALGGPAPYWQAWTYTPSGLRATETDTTTAGASTTRYNYPASGAAHQNSIASTVTSGVGATRNTSYTYDTSGNTTTRPAPDGTPQALTWNDQGQLDTLNIGSGGSNATRFVYGDDGNVLLKDSPTERVLYLGETEAHFNKATGAVTGVRSYSSPLGVIGVRTSNSDFVYTIPNAQNTASVAVNPITWDVSRRWFSPYGEDRGLATGKGWPDQRGFLGKTTDKDTGLTDIGARQYDNSTGAFTSVDPELRVGAGQYGYAYGDNNPITNSDPTGLRPACLDAGACSYKGSTNGNGGKTTARRGYVPPYEPPSYSVVGNVPRPPALSHGYRWVDYGAYIHDPIQMAINPYHNYQARPAAVADQIEKGGRIACHFSPCAGTTLGQVLQLSVLSFSGLFGKAGERPTAAKAIPTLPDGYSSFAAAKRAMGSPGSGKVYDHVVEQSQVKRSGFAIDDINSPFNMNPVTPRTNQIKANYYSTKQPFTGGVTVRDWLNGQSFSKQYTFGMEVLTEIRKGNIK